MPAFGDTFDILTAALVEQKFDTVSLPILADGLGWNVDYQADVVSLAVWLPGDGNGDDVVDGSTTCCGPASTATIRPTILLARLATETSTTTAWLMDSTTGVGRQLRRLGSRHGRS